MLAPGDRRCRRTIIALAAAAAIAIASSCSAAPPEFMSLSSRLVVVATDPAGAADERLSVFASVSDKDGVDDIEYLYVVHDGDELCWSMTAEEWQRDDEGASVWLGSNSLDAPGPAIPRGSYRAVIVDKAGERSERAFSLSAPSTDEYPTPSVTLSGTSITLRSSLPSNTAFFLDSGGNVVMTAPVTSGETALDTLWSDGQWRSGSDYLAVYGFDPKSETGFFSWKIRLPD